MSDANEVCQQVCLSVKVFLLALSHNNLPRWRVKCILHRGRFISLQSKFVNTSRILINILKIFVSHWLSNRACVHTMPVAVQIFNLKSDFKANLPQWGKSAVNEMCNWNLRVGESRFKMQRAIPLSASNSILMGKYISSEKQSETFHYFKLPYNVLRNAKIFSCRQARFSINPSIRLIIAAVNHFDCCQP